MAPTAADLFATWCAAERAARASAHALLYAQEARRLLQTVRVPFPGLAAATNATEATQALCMQLEEEHAARERVAARFKAGLERALGVMP